jgi:hypothetical protein
MSISFEMSSSASSSTGETSEIIYERFCQGFITQAEFDLAQEALAVADAGEYLKAIMKGKDNEIISGND